MTKSDLNQNAKFVQEFEDIFERDFIFGNKPFNRFKISHKNETTETKNHNKRDELIVLKKKINSIENCNLKKIQKI